MSHSCGCGAVGSTLFALIRTSRPFGWLAALALFRIGMAYGLARNTFVTTGLSVALTFPFCLYLFGVNDLADHASDISNPRKGNWIHGASGPVQHTAISRWAPWIAGVVVAMFVPFLPWRAGITLSGVLLVAWAYSSKPLRLKEIPIVDGLCTATIMIGLLCVGFFTNPEPLPLHAEAFAVAPCLAGLHIFASVVDVDADRNANHRTFAVRAGAMRASAAALALSGVSAASIVWLEYAPPIAVYMIVQPSVIAVWMLLHKRIPAVLALSVLGVSGLLTLAHLALVYLPIV